MLYWWIGTAELAALAGTTERAARKAIGLLTRNPDACWRGTRPVLRSRHGRGGRSGLQYEVRVDSLPFELQQRWNAAQRPVKGPLKHDDEARIEREWRYHLIEAALAYPKRSAERSAAIRAVAAEPQFHPTRGREAVSERTLQRWLDLFDKLGLAGLNRAQRKDVGTAKVFVSAAWDRAVPFADAIKATVAADIRQTLRNLWGNGAVYSVVRRLASETLAEVTLIRGFDPGPVALARICMLPKNLVESERRSRRVHEYQTDRKAWNDSRGRIRRSPEGLEPMQLVIGDVHHIDVLLRRADGSAATPKMIAWLDVATHRMRFDLVLCEPDTAVRNEDLIASFIAMTQDPEWGMPAGLYLDNGSEYRFAEFVDDAMQLAGMDVRLTKPESAVKRSAPYEGASKGLLEGSFRILKDACFSVIDGFIGGDRMKSKSANLGRAQTPFSGSFDDFARAVAALIAYHNTNERRGALRGRTPDQVFRAWVERGWRRIDVDPDALMVAFSVEATRVIRQGKISVSGQSYVHDGFAHHEGEKIRVRLPKFTSWPGVPAYTLKGERIGIAEPEPVYGYRDRAGVEEAARRKRRDRAVIQDLAKDVRPTNVVHLMGRSAAGRKGEQPPESGGVVRLRTEDALDGREMADPAAVQETSNAAKQRKQLERLAQVKRDMATGWRDPE